MGYENTIYGNGFSHLFILLLIFLHSLVFLFKIKTARISKRVAIVGVFSAGFVAVNHQQQY